MVFGLRVYGIRVVVVVVVVALTCDGIGNGSLSFHVLLAFARLHHQGLSW